MATQLSLDALHLQEGMEIQRSMKEGERYTMNEMDPFQEERGPGYGELNLNLNQFGLDTHYKASRRGRFIYFIFLPL